MKISVHITFYIEDIKNKKKLQNFNKVINSFLGISKNTYIFIHTNNFKLKINKKNTKLIYHSLTNQNPLRLTWKCRDLISEQKNDYDYFICSEDDSIFSKKNFNYWLKYSKKLFKYKYNPGFLRTEKSTKTRKLWVVDQLVQLDKHIIINNEKFVVVNNPYFAMWIMDKSTLKKFIKSKFWNLNNWRGFNSFTKLYDREKSAVGWHALNMNYFKATVLPITKNKIRKECYFPHQPNKYVAETGMIALNIDNILSKNTKKFIDKKLSKFQVIINEIKFFIYLKLTINFKNLKKEFKIKSF